MNVSQPTAAADECKDVILSACESAAAAVAVATSHTVTQR